MKYKKAQGIIRRYNRAARKVEALKKEMPENSIPEYEDELALLAQDTASASSDLAEELKPIETEIQRLEGLKAEALKRNAQRLAANDKRRSELEGLLESEKARFRRFYQRLAKEEAKLNRLEKDLEKAQKRIADSDKRREQKASSAELESVGAPGAQESSSSNG